MSKFCPYQKEDQVWLEETNLHTSHPSHKLRPKRFGPFEVMEALSLVTYRLNLPQSWKLHNAFHVSLLSPYHEMSEYDIGYLTPTPSLIEGEPEWEVDTILASQHFRQQRQLQYLVKWVGYLESENSWEPAEHL